MGTIERPADAKVNAVPPGRNTLGSLRTAWPTLHPEAYDDNACASPRVRHLAPLACEIDSEDIAPTLSGASAAASIGGILESRIGCSSMRRHRVDEKLEAESTAC